MSQPKRPSSVVLIATINNTVSTSTPFRQSLVLRQIKNLLIIKGKIFVDRKIWNFCRTVQPVHRHAAAVAAAAGEAVVVVVGVGVGVTNDVRKVKSWNKKLEQKQKPEANIKLVTSSRGTKNFGRKLVKISSKISKAFLSLIFHLCKAFYSSTNDHSALGILSNVV